MIEKCQLIRAICLRTSCLSLSNKRYYRSHLNNLANNFSRSNLNCLPILSQLRNSRQVKLLTRRFYQFGNEPTMNDLSTLSKMSVVKMKQIFEREMRHNFITTTQAMHEYALDITHLADLRKFQRRSQFFKDPPVTVYMRKDVEKRAWEIWGSFEELETELKKRKANEAQRTAASKPANKEYHRMNMDYIKLRHEVLRNSAQVVLLAVAINGTNFMLKLTAWCYTGSHSMFSESIHSLADTLNQLLLAFGIFKSIQEPDKNHPYGYQRMRFIVALISGVAIFFTGTGVSIYHGIEGLVSQTEVESQFWTYMLLLASLISEGGTFLVALKTIRKSAQLHGVSAMSYIRSGVDPTLNVVLLEDFASVLGVGIAMGCMGCTELFGTPDYDAIGSLMIGGLLGVVASFVIYSNALALVGKSIAPERVAAINDLLESDEMVRAIHSTKAIDIGGETIRYRADIDFDGRQLSRNYLETVDMEKLFEEFKQVKTVEECEDFLLKHGEHIVNMLGAEVDRIENQIQTQFPQVRHVDLEAL